jgi:hypothetical protein
MNKNLTFLERKNKVLFAADVNPAANNKQVVATFLKDISQLGYTLSVDLIQTLFESSTQSIVALQKDVVYGLKEMLGDNVTYRPMYPNFPAQVLEAEESELFINAILHYWFGLLPDYEKTSRLRLAEKTKVKVIYLGTIAEFEAIFTNILGSKSSISAEDKALIMEFSAAYKDDILRLVPAEVPSKEQVALLADFVLPHTSLGQDTEKAVTFLQPYVKTATDVLRIAASMSNADVSLADRPRFLTFNRRERKFLLSLMDRIPDAMAVEDMARRKGMWLRLGEKLHPGEFKDVFPTAFKSFDRVRNEKVRTFNGKVEMALLGDVNEAIDLLKSRPGDFARRLNQLLSNPVVNGLSIRDAFAIAAEKVSTPVLIQLYSYLESRPTMGKRIVFPKGNIAHAQFIDAPAPMEAKIPQLIQVDILGALMRRFAERESMGKVYIDPKLRNYLVPFSERSASKALRTIVRGSKLDMPESNFVRFFLYWKNAPNGHTDIDLSATLYGDNFKSMGGLSFHGLTAYNCAHSGDITNAPNGACEFIDLDVAALKSAGVRYVSMVVNSFSGQLFTEMSECFAGWMARQDRQSGEVFEPKTVEQRIDMTTASRMAVPVFFDLLESKIIWADMAVPSAGFYHTAAKAAPTTEQLLEGFAKMKKFSIGELLELHVASRGELVTTPAEADLVFSETEGITPFDTEIFASQYL